MKKNYKKISIIVPVFNNQYSLDLLLNQLQIEKKALSKLNLESEIVIVDDGSSDNSFDLLRKFKQKYNFKLIKLAKNFGSVNASLCGIQNSTGDAFVIISADLQDPVSLISKMAHKWIAGSKYVICVRRKRDDPFLKILEAKIFYFLLRRLVCKNYPKNGYDLMLFNKQIRDIVIDSGKHFYTPINIFNLGFEPFVISYDRQKRVGGKSQWTLKKKINQAIDIFFSSSLFQLRIISTIGFLLFFISLIYATVILFNALLGKIDVPGYSSLIITILVMNSLILLSIGILGEYVWRIFNQINKEKKFIIDEIY